MPKNNQLHLIGYASGQGGVDLHCGEGPQIIQQSIFLSEIVKRKIIWETILSPSADHSLRLDERLQEINLRLAMMISELLQHRQFPIVIGGDHTSAIGLWSGAYDALHQTGELGLIWIDAHMDSHTPETTESGRLHGMPLATLMGYGYSTLTHLLHDQSKLKPENICLIGVRSFEKGEAVLLKKLNVRIYFMDEVKKRGLIPIFAEAVRLVTQNTKMFGISLDLDSIDPKEAPAVGVPEPDGISSKELFEGMESILYHPQLVAMEITEFDPSRDVNYKTEKLIMKLLELVSVRGSNV